MSLEGFWFTTVICKIQGYYKQLEDDDGQPLQSVMFLIKEKQLFCSIREACDGMELQQH